MGDKASSSTNPEIKNITVDNLFKRESLSALNASGITFYDDGGNASLFIKDGGNVGVGGTTANYDLQVNGDFYVTGGIFDCTGASGSANQYLKSLGNENYQWVDTSTLGGGTVSGSGSANYIPKWNSSSGLTNSAIYEVSCKIGIGETSPGATFHSCGILSGSDAIVQNCNGAIVELRRNLGTTVDDSLYLSNTESGFSLGSSNSFANSNININSTGNLGVRTTTLSAALNVSTDQLLVGDFYSSHTSGSVIYFKNTSSSAYSNVVSYSNKDGSDQKVNWITGTFNKSSDKYFGISYKNTNLSQSDAKFDDSTVCNNLFYINTGGSASLAHNIHTHNKTNTGHNTGRFVYISTIPFEQIRSNWNGTSAVAANNFSYAPAFGINPFGVYNSDFLMPITSEFTNSNSSTFERAMAWGWPPYAGRLIKVHARISGARSISQGDVIWRFLNSEGSGSDSTYYEGSFQWSTNTNVISSENSSIPENANTTFSAGQELSFALAAPSGQWNALVDLVYEFKIT
jgi:hypothetical protein